ncbi:MAG: hypothetical protein EHV01_005345 [Spiroplasma sp. hy2]|uniref:hypothetical protein n=1 Tax=Spiroplasma sp. hy2 TaxID=2490850 RepID=UPI00383EF628
MKKLLSLLSVLTISGTAVPTTIAASPYQKEENINSDISHQTNNLESLLINRSKRSKNSYNEFKQRTSIFYTFSSQKGEYSLTFTPDFWEEVVILYENEYYNFANKFKNKVIDNIEFSVFESTGSSFDKYESMEKLGEAIHNNWNYINNKWENSDKKSRLRIYFDGIKVNIKIGSRTKNIKYYDAVIKSDDAIKYSNKYLDNLINDFNDFNNSSINLGIIDNNDNNTILNAVKKQNPNLKIEHLEIFEKTPYSHFTYNFSARLKVNKQSTIYSKFILKPKLVYVTKEFLENDLSKLIDNDNLIESWNLNFNSWENEVNRQIKEDIPSFTLEQKRTWKGDKLNNLNDKLLSLQHILTTIDLKFKSNELYDSLTKLKEDINNLKQQIINLNNEINNIKQKLEEGKGLKMCSDIAGNVGTIAQFIPKVGKIISGVAKVTGATCKIISILN